MLSYFSPESRVPTDHPLRTVKTYADATLRQLSGKFDALDADTGRPSIPPERLLIALYSVRSDRLFCEMLDYNILFRWFLDMDLEQPGWTSPTSRGFASGWWSGTLCVTSSTR
jgi:transposase